MAEDCNIALVGQKFMGRAHSNAYLKAAKFFNLPLNPVMHTIVGRDLIALSAFAARWGWKHFTTSWKEVLKDPAINLIDVSTPNYMHAEQAVSALAAGKHVAVEKPLAATLKDARLMKNAAAKYKKCKTFVWYNYRRAAAVALAHQLVKDGRIGRIYHIRANYLQSWAGPETPLTWRFQKKFAGSGAHGDLNSHIIDMARFVSGQEITEILGAVSETYIEERPLPASVVKQGVVESIAKRRARAKSDVDDATLFLARFNGGAIGSFEATRVATGNQNNNTIEVNGEFGALKFSFEDMNVLWFFDAREDPKVAGWRRIMATTAGHHPYAAAWWPEAHIVGYEHTFVNMVADMMAVLAGREPIVPLPDFNDAYEVQRVLEAVLISAKHRAAIKMTEIK